MDLTSLRHLKKIDTGSTTPNFEGNYPGKKFDQEHHGGIEIMSLDRPVYENLSIRIELFNEQHSNCVHAALADAKGEVITALTQLPLPVGEFVSIYVSNDFAAIGEVMDA